jgi:hypothetical protein
LRESSSKSGFSLNKKKTTVMVISKKEMEIKSSIQMERRFLKQITRFKFLGTIITSNLDATQKLAVGKDRQNLFSIKMKNFLCN